MIGTPPGPAADPPGEAWDDDWGDIREDSTDPRFALGDLVYGPAPVPPPPSAPGPTATQAAGAVQRADRAADARDRHAAHPPGAPARRVQQLGIIGGKGVGKSYLFQAMVYRVQHARTAGALAYFLDRAGVELVKNLAPRGGAQTISLQRFNGDYERWTRLTSTLATQQPWYRLTLPYRTGLLGRTRAAMEVELFDGSGEQFFEARDPQQRGLWEQAYGAARVMAFCLPLWVPFPAPDLARADRRERDRLLESFHEVLQNYRDLRRRLGQRGPVHSILALTMADDRRGGLPLLRDTWIGGYLQEPQAFLAQTRTGRGIARYLANARRVSGYLHAAFATAPAPGIAGIPDLLGFGAGRPWLIPVSAIHGEALEQLEEIYPNPDERPPRPPPVPAHVELPLLVALCEHGNALM